jgi:hypothetical protein
MPTLGTCVSWPQFVPSGEYVYQSVPSPKYTLPPKPWWKTAIPPSGTTTAEGSPTYVRSELAYLASSSLFHRKPSTKAVSGCPLCPWRKIEILHLNLLVQRERRDHKLRKPVLWEHLPLPRLLAQGWPHRQLYAALYAGSNSKICDFLRKYRSQSSPLRPRPRWWSSAVSGSWPTAGHKARRPHLRRADGAD